MPTFTIPTPIGNLTLHCEQTTLTSIKFSPKKLSPTLPSHIQKIADEIHHYFNNPRHRFKLNLQPQGTPFQQTVWNALKAIPTGTTLSYQQLAHQLATSPRAIGNACRANPFPIVIPCHRVIAKNHLGGYSGKTAGKMLGIKEWLLKHESTKAPQYLTSCWISAYPNLGAGYQKEGVPKGMSPAIDVIAE